MRIRIRLVASAAALGLGLASWTGCGLDTPSTPDVPLTPQDNRILRPVVALGNSLTAGFMNAGLEQTGQLYSVPNQLARQVGGPALDTQAPIYLQLPLVAAPGIGSTAGKSSLFVDGTTFAITRSDVTDPMSLLLNAEVPIPYDNLGVPGATTMDVLNATSSENSQAPGNAYFDLILRNSVLPPFDTTQLDQLEAQFTRTTTDLDHQNPQSGDLKDQIALPRVVTIWIGNNDILGGALTGNPQVGVNVTPVEVWEPMFLQILDKVAGFSGTAQIAVANLQEILPYFTTVPTGTMVSGNFVPWTTDEADVQFVLLPAASELDPPLGPDYIAAAGGTESIPGNYTLTTSEYGALLTEIQAYNAVIEREADARGWAYVDVAAAFNALPADPTNPPTYGQLNRLFPWFDRTGDGIPEQNVTSAFTLDGIHPSEKGYSEITNLFTAALNAAYGTSYPSIDVSQVVNTAGFEQLVIKKTTDVPIANARFGPRFETEGRAGLRSVVDLFVADR